MLESTNASYKIDFRKAACLGIKPDNFYPTRERGGMTPENRKRTADALAVCASCSIQKECLDYAVRYEPLGLWGGKSEVEREVIRRRMGIELPLNRAISDSARRSARSLKFMRAVSSNGDKLRS